MQAPTISPTRPPPPPWPSAIRTKRSNPAAQADTTLIWNLSAVTLFFMAMPNLIGILLLRKDMKATTEDYWKRVKSRS